MSGCAHDQNLDAAAAHNPAAAGAAAVLRTARMRRQLLTVRQEELQVVLLSLTLAVPQLAETVPLAHRPSRPSTDPARRHPQW